MSVAVEWLGWAFLALGSFFCVVGGLGLVRMPDFYTRMHAASVTDTVGAGFLLLGMMLFAGFSLVTVKLVIVGFLIFFTSPTATHALAKAGLHRGVEPKLALERTRTEAQSSKH
jgi:multicomponent Na+:H+ antiporter subunit G